MTRGDKFCTLEIMMERLSFLIAYVGSAALVAFFAAVVSHSYEHAEAQLAAQDQTEMVKPECGDGDVPVPTIGDAVVCASLAAVTAVP
jgi:hypothetical protein